MWEKGEKYDILIIEEAAHVLPQKELNELSPSNKQTAMKNKARILIHNSSLLS